jgi:riboflavin synthase alpha subunit
LNVAVITSKCDLYFCADLRVRKCRCHKLERGICVGANLNGCFMAGHTSAAAE